MTPFLRENTVCLSKQGIVSYESIKAFSQSAWSSIVKLLLSLRLNNFHLLRSLARTVFFMQEAALMSAPSKSS